MVVDHHDFAFGHMAVVDHDVDRLAGKPIELDHLVWFELEQIVQGHFRAAQMEMDGHSDVLQLLQIERSPCRFPVLDFQRILHCDSCFGRAFSYYNPLAMTNAAPGIPGSLSIKHMPGLRGVPREDLRAILDSAQFFRAGLDRRDSFPKSLAGVSVVNLFFENSTRTRLSFETAQKKLGASPMNFTASSSSAAKGESLRDTVRNIEAMGADVFVVRHSSAGVPKFLADHTSAVVINAGDGACEHPTQGLLDALTMRQHLGELEGREVAIIGDIRHSRVARSNIWALSTLGARVRLWGPATLLPRSPNAFGSSVTVAQSLDAALDGADAVVLLRIQHERQSSGMLPSLREYRQSFGIDQSRLKLARPEALVLHPGPINRGVEVVSEVADGHQSVILEQVTNGVAVRMACLHLLAGRAV